MYRYSALALARKALANTHWPRAWRDPEPKPHYDFIVVGGGGHGLAAAYYLAKNHGARSVAVLERGWIGGGNTGRNTTIVRSNYRLPENQRFYEFSVQLWETLSAELNFNVMFSQRGVLHLGHSDRQMSELAERGNAMRLMGIDGEILSRDDVARMVPLLDCTADARFPVHGGLLQPRAGTARHDAVAWGYARAASALGVDIIQNCEVTGFESRDNRILAVQTSRGRIGAGRIGLAVAGNTSHVAALAGLRLPIETHLLQAMVTEPVKPMIDTVVMSGAVHSYVSQTDKGEVIIGGDLDLYPSYSQRGSFARVEEVAAQAMALFPALGGLRIMRCWAGAMDMTMDGSPIIGKTPRDNLFMSGGWCYGGFKATPASGYCLAHTLFNGEPHPLVAPFALDRFETGDVINENGQGPVPQLH
jgi:sarcosine oxidase subunit beta